MILNKITAHIYKLNDASIVSKCFWIWGLGSRNPSRGSGGNCPFMLASSAQIMRFQSWKLQLGHIEVRASCLRILFFRYVNHTLALLP